MTAIDDRQPDAGDRAQHRDAGGAADRQPELPALDAPDAAQVGDLDQADGRGDHHRRQRGCGQVLQQVREPARAAAATPSAPTTPVSWVRAPGGFGHRRARRTAADGKPWKNPAARLAAPEADHFLVGIDAHAAARGVGAREHAGVGEGHQRDGEPAEQRRGRHRRSAIQRHARTPAAPAAACRAPKRRRSRVQVQHADERRSRRRRRSAGPARACWPLSRRITASVPAPTRQRRRLVRPSSSAVDDGPQARRAARRRRSRSRTAWAAG